MTGAPRKQRTRQHVIADLSVHHVEGFVLAEGHTAQRIHPDYGYDLVLSTYDKEGYIEPGSVLVQVKASETLRRYGGDYAYDLHIRDYNLWISEERPVILILYDASRRRAFWVHVQQFFRENPNRRPERGAKSIRVRVPNRQVVNRRAIAAMRELKTRFKLHLVGGGS